MFKPRVLCVVLLGLCAVTGCTNFDCSCGGSTATICDLGQALAEDDLDTVGMTGKCGCKDWQCAPSTKDSGPCETQGLVSDSVCACN